MYHNECKPGQTRNDIIHIGNRYAGKTKMKRVVLFVKNVLVDLIQEASMLVKVFIRKMSKLPLTMAN